MLKDSKTGLDSGVSKKIKTKDKILAETTSEVLIIPARTMFN
jgi:hypothetical protein